EGYWSHLAAAGDPNGGSAPVWPRYDAATDPYLELNTTISSGAGLAATSCDVIDAAMPGGVHFHQQIRAAFPRQPVDRPFDLDGCARVREVSSLQRLASGARPHSSLPCWSGAATPRCRRPRATTRVAAWIETEWSPQMRPDFPPRPLRPRLEST